LSPTRERVGGELNREEGGRIQKELEEGKGLLVDKIVIGGPGNSLVKHGIGGERGFGAERKVTLTEGKGAVEDRASTTYHLTEPGRMTLCERAQLTSVMVGVVKSCRERWPDAEIYYTGTLPRFVTKCCGRREHMSGDDPLVINNCRKELDRELMNKFVGERMEVKVPDWWEMVGLTGEPTLKEMVEKKLVSGDNVHLSAEANRNAAVFLCRRLLITEEDQFPGSKRRRLY